MKALDLGKVKTRSKIGMETNFHYEGTNIMYMVNENESANSQVHLN